jgi:hypothetical protein
MMNSHHGGAYVVQVYKLKASILGLCHKKQQKADSIWKCFVHELIFLDAGRDEWSNFLNN